MFPLIFFNEEVSKHICGSILVNNLNKIHKSASSIGLKPKFILRKLNIAMVFYVIIRLIIHFCSFAIQIHQMNKVLFYVV